MGRKITEWIFQATNEIVHKKMWTCLLKVNFKKETKSLLIAAGINAIRTNNGKAKIDDMRQIRRCTVNGNRDKMINPLISKCRDVTQYEYKMTNDWERKVIH